MFYLDDVQWSQDEEELHCIYEELPKNRKIIEKFSHFLISDKFCNLKRQKGAKEDARKIIKNIVINEKIFREIIIKKIKDKKFSEKLNKEKVCSFNITPTMFNNIDFRENKIYY